MNIIFQINSIKVDIYIYIYICMYAYIKFTFYSTLKTPNYEEGGQKNFQNFESPYREII